MTTPLLWLFAVAGGAAVGNLYYVQPLLELIAHGLHVQPTTAGLLVTATQIGYGTGIFFIVPLGDIRNRRRLIPAMMASSAIALGACAVAPNLAVLAIAVTAVGVTTVSAQILTPFAGDLSDDASRGRVVGIVVSGLITGILVARIFAGVVGGAAGWRTVFALAACLMVALAILVYRALPDVEPKAALPYMSLLASVLSIVARERALQIIMSFGAITMATFTLFWTALTFLLSGAPYRYPASVIGLFGLAGLLGSVAAQGAGRLHDRGWSNRASGLAWTVTVAAWAASALGGHSLVWLLIGIVALDIATQTQRILNQAQIFTLSTEYRSRVNTAYVTSNFIGGAAGSVCASLLWSVDGWNGIIFAGTGLCLLALGIWSLTRATLRPLSGRQAVAAH